MGMGKECMAKQCKTKEECVQKCGQEFADKYWDKMCAAKNCKTKQECVDKCGK
mgnify:CR=1 FL=1